LHNELGRIVFGCVEASISKEAKQIILHRGIRAVSALFDPAELGANSPFLCASLV
jgi:hypothetical protein